MGWYITQPVVTRITNPSTRRTQKREMRNDEKLFAKIKQNGPNRARKIKNGDTYCNIICWIFVFFCVFFFCKKFNIFLLKWKATHTRRGKIIRVKTIGKNVQHSYFNPFCCCCRFVLGIATVNIVLYGTHKLLRIIK